MIPSVVMHCHNMTLEKRSILRYTGTLEFSFKMLCGIKHLYFEKRSTFLCFVACRVIDNCLNAFDQQSKVQDRKKTLSDFYLF